MTFCGLDFGTSNSTLGVLRDGDARLLPLEPPARRVRSAMFFNDHDRAIAFGSPAIDQYLAHEEGRLLMSIKSVLGTSLMGERTQIFDRLMPFAEVLGLFIAHLKTTAERHLGQPLTRVVLGRPVHFHDTDPDKDRQAEELLRRIALDQGFAEVVFQFEPIAAAKAFARGHPGGRLAVIVDIGGGTSDFTLLRTGRHSDGTADDIIASAGVHVGGTDLDQAVALGGVMPLLGLGGTLRALSGQTLEVPSAYFHDLSTWHRINHLYNPRTLGQIDQLALAAHDPAKIARLRKVLKNRDGHRILARCEMAKIALSDLAASEAGLEFIEPGMVLTLTAEAFAGFVREKVGAIVEALRDLLRAASVAPAKVDTVFFTGGSTGAHYLREQVRALFPAATPVYGDPFGSVGLGLTYEAIERFGRGS